MELIEEKVMSKNYKLQIIAEIASNWNGNETLGKKIIKKNSQSGADYVKFQMWRAEDLYSRDIPEWNNIKKSEMIFKNSTIPINILDYTFYLFA